MTREGRRAGYIEHEAEGWKKGGGGGGEDSFCHNETGQEPGNEAWGGRGAGSMLLLKDCRTWWGGIASFPGSWGGS